MTYASPAIKTPLPVDNQDDARVLLARLEASMEGLIELIEAETKLVREGKLFAAAELENKKTEYAKAYVEIMASAVAQEQTIKTMLPDSTEKLRLRHDEFKSLLKFNMSTLSTARSVTQGLITGVANQMNQQQIPTTYGAQGTMNNMTPKAMPGLTTDKSF
ncbi:MAG: hypothetical protein ABJ081_12175 [Hyphomicrobiales bacterium]